MLFLVNSKSNIFNSNYRGKIAENLAKQDYLEHGYRITPIKIGADFIAVKKIDGKIHKEVVEVKAGDSRLSKNQKRKRKEIRKKGHQYTIYRVSTVFLNNYLLTKGESN